MAGIIVGSTAVEVLPSAQRWNERLREAILPGSARIGDEVGKVIGERIFAKVRSIIPDALRASRPASERQGAETGSAAGGKFAETLRARVEAALRSLPKANVGVDATDADRRLAELRAQLAALRDARVGVDLTDDEAIAKVALLRAELARLGAESPNVGVKVDTGAADAKLAAFEAEIRAIAAQSPTVNVDVDDRGSIARTGAGMSGLLVAGLALGSALVPVAAVIAAAFAGIAASIGAGIAAVGVGILGFSGISGAVKALSAEQNKSGAAAVRAAGQQRSAAFAIESAQAQLRSSEASLANTRASAADSTVRAAEQVRSAEQNLRTAQQDARLAQLALTDARHAAAQQLEDLNTQVADGALAQRQALLSLEDAQRQLDALQNDPTATDLQRRQAQLGYEQAKQQIADLGIQQRRLQDQKATADKAGINGSQQVIAAQRGIQQAHQHELDARRSLADAIRAQTAQQRQNAFAVSQAEAQVANAMRGVQQASQAAGSAGTSAIDKVRRAMAGLSPAGREFARFIVSIKGRFTELKQTAQTGLLPGVERGLKAMMPLFPLLNQFVSVVAHTMGDLFAQAGKALNSPFWRQFFSYVSSTAGPMLRTMGGIIGNVAKGFASLLMAFQPVTNQIGAGLLRLSRGFANIGQSQGLQKFVGYVRKYGPEIMHILGQIVGAVVHIGVALAPIGLVVLRSLGFLARVIRSIPTPVLTALLAVVLPLVGAIWAIGVATKAWEGIQKLVKVATVAWTVVQWALNAALSANPIGLIIIAIAALIVGIILLWKHCETFRKIVKAVFHAVWSVISTVFNWIKEHWPLLLAILTGPIGIAVYIIIKHWHAITNGIHAVITWISSTWHKVTNMLTSPIRSAVRWIGNRIDDMVGWFTALPGRIGRAAKGMWDGIQNAFKAAINGVIDIWNKLVGFLKIPGFHHFGINWGGVDLGKNLKIPRLALGGIVIGAGRALVGDRGPEILDLPIGARVTPLPRMAEVAANDIPAGGGNLVINVAGHVLTERQLVDVVLEGMRRSGRGGRVLLPSR